MDVFRIRITRNDDSLVLDFVRNDDITWKRKRFEYTQIEPNRSTLNWRSSWNTQGNTYASRVAFKCDQSEPEITETDLSQKSFFLSDLNANLGLSKLIYVINGKAIHVSAA